MTPPSDIAAGKAPTSAPVAPKLDRSPFSAISVTRSYEQVVRQIESAIRSGQLGRGERLPTERELGATFDVSRGVVREAIKVLSAMGLVEARQGSGLYVRNEPIQSVTRAFVLSVSPSAESVEKLFEFRAGLEREAASFAAIRRSETDLEAISQAVTLTEQSREPLDWIKFGDADQEFHRAIALASGNPYLAVAITTAREMQRDVVNLFSKHPGSIDTAINHHQLIFAAIRDRNSDEAARLMTEHVRYTANAVQTNVPLLGSLPTPPTLETRRAIHDRNRRPDQPQTSEPDHTARCDHCPTNGLGHRREILGLPAAHPEPAAGGGGGGLSRSSTASGSASANTG